MTTLDSQNRCVIRNGEVTMSSELERQLGDVTPESSAGDDDHIEPEDIEIPDTEVTAEETDDDKPKAKGRDAENVYRELSRKNEHLSGQLTSLQARFESAIERMEASAQAAPPDATNGDPLAVKTVAQLKNLRSQVPEENLAAFDEYVSERQIQETVDARVGAFEQKQTASQARKQTAQEAVNTYPDLAKPGSDFAQAVDKELKRLGRSYTNNNPYALLDASNRVAIRDGYGAKTTSPRIPGRPATKRNASPAPKAKDGPSMDVERATKIASGLKNALPKGAKFDVEKMRESTEQYRQNRDFFIKR